MDLELLEKFFLWCLIINTIIYAITAIAAYVMRDFVYSVNKRMFNLDEEVVSQSMQSYLTNFKLLITIFNFTPWVAILIIN